MTDPAAIRKLIDRIAAWQNDDRQGYDWAIGLLCDAKTTLEQVLALLPPQEPP